MPNRFSLADIDRRKAVVRDVLGPIAQAKRDSTIATFYKRVMPSEQGRIHTSLAPDTASGRLSSSESALFRDCSSNLQNQPKKIAKLDKLYHVRDLFIPDEGMVLVAGDYCLAPETRVLTADLRWPRIDTLTIGQEIIGFDEERPHGRGKRRRYRRATVEHLGRATLPSYRVTTDRGIVTASAAHLWLSKSSGNYQWRRTDTLVPGIRLQFFVQPWEEDRSYDGGRIRGFVEGEGWLSGGAEQRGCDLGFAQNAGPLRDEIVGLIRSRGFALGPGGGSSTALPVTIDGGRPEQLRFLGTVRPSRLIWSKAWENRAVGGHAGRWATVISVEYLGDREVITIATSTKTLIAEGLLSHNSGAEAVLVAAYMQDWPFYEQLLAGMDVHAEHGRGVYGADYDDPEKTDLLRQIVKSVTYASFYYASVPILQRTVNKDVEHLNLYLSQAQVADVRAVILQRHPIERWWEETRRLLERQAGVLRNCFGYSRTFRAPDPHKRLKEALSFFPQSTVAWLMNDALPLLYDNLDRPGELELLLQIHDEALFQCRPEFVRHLVQTATPILQREFQVHDHPIHIPVEWSTGPDWGHLKKMKVTVPHL